jgi:hypothetical protein
LNTLLRALAIFRMDCSHRTWLQGSRQGGLSGVLCSLRSAWHHGVSSMAGAPDTCPPSASPTQQHTCAAGKGTGASCDGMHSTSWALLQCTAAWLVLGWHLVQHCEHACSAAHHPPPAPAQPRTHLDTGQAKMEWNTNSLPSSSSTGSCSQLCRSCPPFSITEASLSSAGRATVPAARATARGLSYACEGGRGCQ